MDRLRWLDATQQSVLNAVASGKKVFCESLSYRSPEFFQVFRQPPSILRLPGLRDLWRAGNSLATFTPKATMFGSWMSDKPWEAPFVNQALGTARYTFITGEGKTSPTLGVHNRLVFEYETSHGSEVGASAGFGPATPSLSVSAGLSEQHVVNYEGTLFGVEDPPLRLRVISGEELQQLVVDDALRWVASRESGFDQAEAGGLNRQTFNEATGWLLDAESGDHRFATEVLEVPEGTARLFRGRARLDSDGLFAFAIEFLHDDDTEVGRIAISDPVVGFSKSLNAVSRFV